jgi:hypothetical protein
VASPLLRRRLRWSRRATVCGHRACRSANAAGDATSAASDLRC